MHEIVKQAIEKTFFSKIEVRDTYGSIREVKPPILEQVMKEVLLTHLKSAVRDWVAENGDKILESWQKILDQGVMEYVAKIQQEKIAVEIRNTFSPLVTYLNDERRRLGLPPLFTPY